MFTITIMITFCFKLHQNNIYIFIFNINILKHFKNTKIKFNFLIDSILAVMPKTLLFNYV